MFPFSEEDLCVAVKNYLPSIEEYIKSHQGSMKLLGVKGNTVYIELGGACNGCSMSTMTTKMVAQKRLRELIHPDLIVENILEMDLPKDVKRCN